MVAFISCAALAILTAFSLLRYLGWSFAYSGVLGLRSQAVQVQTAHERAWIFSVRSL
jgi:hypothetical protein